MEKIEEVAVIVSGSSATWPSNPANPMKLVLVNGQWKLDLANSFPSPDVLRSSIETFDAISVYISDVANEVASGKYKTIPEVQQEIKRRGQAVGR
jgi:hypothetical protein